MSNLKPPRVIYQHATPQRDIDHAVWPTMSMKCATCGKPVKRFPANEGPEGLKALLRF